jgi:hypothetical protein
MILESVALSSVIYASIERQLFCWAMACLLFLIAVEIRPSAAKVAHHQLNYEKVFCLGKTQSARSSMQRESNDTSLYNRFSFLSFVKVGMSKAKKLVDSFL